MTQEEIIQSEIEKLKQEVVQIQTELKLIKSEEIGALKAVETMFSILNSKIDLVVDGRTPLCTLCTKRITDLEKIADVNEKNIRELQNFRTANETIANTKASLTAMYISYVMSLLGLGIGMYAILHH